MNLEIITNVKGVDEMKNENDFAISVTYKGKEYHFDYGSQAYIFHTGIYNDIPKKYGIKGLLEYTALVQLCYITDINRTSLGELADYVAVRWRKLRNQNEDDILEHYYDEVA